MKVRDMESALGLGLRRPVDHRMTGGVLNS
jgi:hypothetical protein